MPVARYFLFVGGALLALLFLIDAYVPSQAVVASHAAPSIDRNVVRIRSDQKLPERVVYDTSLPTIVPPAAKTQVAAIPPRPAADPMVQARARDSFAQLVPAEAKKLEKQIGPPAQTPRKRKIARTHAPQPISPQPMFSPQPTMRFAQQQQHFGFFGNSTW
jgi:hypothetical protein